MIGYHKNCKICNSEQRAEVEKMHEDGASLQRIVDFLERHGVTLSKPAVSRHFNKHFAPREEAAKRYAEQSETVMKDAVEKRLTDLQMLDATIERNYRLHVLASENVQESLTKEFPLFNKQGAPIMDPETGKQMTRKFDPSKPMVDLLTGAAAEVRQAIKLKADLLGETDNTVSVTFVDDLDD